MGALPDKTLRKNGYTVTIVQNPTTSLADDVAVTRRTIAAQDGPVVLVGHSYGGVVITEADNDPKVAALVYIAAFAPDKGNSVQTLIAHPKPGAPVPPILPPQDGYLFLDRAKFAASFAADVQPDAADFMADSQYGWEHGPQYSWAHRPQYSWEHRPQYGWGHSPQAPWASKPAPAPSRNRPGAPSRAGTWSPATTA